MVCVFKGFSDHIFPRFHLPAMTKIMGSYSSPSHPSRIVPPGSNAKWRKRWAHIEDSSTERASAANLNGPERPTQGEGKRMPRDRNSKFAPKSLFLWNSNVDVDGFEFGLSKNQRFKNRIWFFFCCNSNSCLRHLFQLERLSKERSR